MGQFLLDPDPPRGMEFGGSLKRAKWVLVSEDFGGFLCFLAKNRKNKKLLRNLHMLDGLALCFDPDNSEPETFLN